MPDLSSYLWEFMDQWKTALGRDVNFVGYPKPEVPDATEFNLRGKK